MGQDYSQGGICSPIPATPASPKLDPVDYNSPEFNVDARHDTGSVDGSAATPPAGGSANESFPTPGPSA